LKASQPFKSREFFMIRLSIAASALLLAFAAAQSLRAQEPAYESWPRLVNPFESTSGGGVMIDGYKPVVSGNACTTDFSVKMPDGAIYQNEIRFDAVPKQGGIHCANGQWRAKDGSASGTTPFEMFIKDGVVRRSP
jgi:hypothetical protein